MSKMVHSIRAMPLDIMLKLSLFREGINYDFAAFRNGNVRPLDPPLLSRHDQLASVFAQWTPVSGERSEHAGTRDAEPEPEPEPEPRREPTHFGRTGAAETVCSEPEPEP